mmetsp:Transcript_6679/g.21610  ORF Transcript_6679/g.21610 Transcript_6679/m.21610 type:complete len:318 (-) Transcript_6679:64-1017(-)
MTVESGSTTTPTPPPPSPFDDDLPLPPLSLSPSILAKLACILLLFCGCLVGVILSWPGGQGTTTECCIDLCSIVEGGGAGEGGRQDDDDLLLLALPLPPQTTIGSINVRQSSLTTVHGMNIRLARIEGSAGRQSLGTLLSLRAVAEETQRERERTGESDTVAPVAGSPLPVCGGAPDLIAARSVVPSAGLLTNTFSLSSGSEDAWQLVLSLTRSSNSSSIEDSVAATLSLPPCTVLPIDMCLTSISETPTSLSGSLPLAIALLVVLDLIPVFVYIIITRERERERERIRNGNSWLSREEMIELASGAGANVCCGIRW